ncbi:MAG: hypothetical protein HYV09_03635 [Deltaproteobacteria bacterium]|nr:hypothetical protein [Deltaproteobacteria bacterium]
MTQNAPSQAIRALGVALLSTWALLAARGFFPDKMAWVALGAFAAALGVGLAAPGAVSRLLSWVMAPSERAFVVACAAVAALASFLVVSGPMRDRPVSIDGVVYLFQARALSHGHFGATLPEPAQLFGARFLFEGADGRLHGVFPPGFPLLLVPFVWLGAPMIAGPTIAAALVFAQWLLGRAIEGKQGEGKEGEGEQRVADHGAATRWSLLLSLPSFARASETSDLLSHAWVAALGTTAVALALLCRERATVGRLLAIGAAIGWAMAARHLDGLVLGAFVAAILLHAVATKKLGVGRALLPLLSLLPFVALVLLANRAASGSPWIPTQTEYFARSDWPTSCHRLGFGWDVGCAVEHADERATFGPDGYGAADALRVVRERAGTLGGDLFAFAPIALLGFLGVARRGRGVDALLASMVVVFTVAYGLFYYGSSALFGARHLFAVAPFVWLLVARALVDEEGRRRAVIAAVVVAMLVGAAPRWISGVARMRQGQIARVDVRDVIRRAGIDRGLVVTGDQLSWIAAFDPSDGPLVARFDGSGLKDLRRAFPDLPVHSVLAGDQLQTQVLPPPPPGLLVELERAWPSFLRPNGVGTKTANAKSCCKVQASGDHVLYVFEAREGASFTIPFSAPRAGRFALRVDGMVAPDYGTWSIAIDEHALPPWDGWAKDIAHKPGAPSAPIDLAAGRHVLTFRCTGRNPASTGYRAAFDALVGVLP